MIFLFKLILVLIPVLVSVAFLTLLERKVLGIIGIRKGPYKVSLGGILQPIGDAVKLSNKQLNSISRFSYFFYYFSRIFILTMSLILWEFFRFSNELVSSKNRILLVIIVLAVISLKSIISGWRTFRKFSLIGSLRTLSILITYESILYVSLIVFILIFDSLSLKEINAGFHFASILPLLLILWLISTMAELNRTPFDFSEGERELVRGFNTEFGSKCFTVLFLSEYRNIIFIIMIRSFLFFTKFFLYFTVLLFFIIWIRGVIPRYRYDKIIAFAWKLLIPAVTLIFLLLGIFI